MDKKTVFVKTSMGAGEASNQSDHLYGDAKRVLLLVDDFSTLAEISKRAPPSLRASLEEVLQDLAENGYIRDSKEPENAPQKSALKFATPKFATPKVAPPPPPKEAQEEMELDFSFIAASPPKPAPPKAAPPKPSEVNPEIVKAQARAGAEMKAKQEAEAARVKAAQTAQIEATAAAAKAKAYAEAKAKAKAEVEARARYDAELRMKNEAETARLKAEKEAAQERAELETAKARAETELRARAIAAERIKKEAEAARLKAERDAAQARAELDAAKAKMEAEIRVRVEAEARAKHEAEAARLKAEREAEEARAELAAARVKADAEARARIESEARVEAEIKARLKLEAEELRLKAENEEAQARAKRAEERARAEAEVQARIDTEARVKAEVEARLKQEVDEARQKAELEDMEARSKQQAAKAKVENEARLRIEAEARIRAEVEARILQEEDAARLQAAKVLVELDAVKAKAEADAKALVEAAARIRAEAEARLKQEEEAARIRAEKERADALIDPAEKIRMSFAHHSPEDAGKKGSGAPSFKFDSFSLGQSASATIPPRKMAAESNQTQAAAGGNSKVKAAVDQRAEQEAATLRARQEEEARIAAEKESARLKAEHEAYKAKVAEEEARAKAEQEARKQAEEQSKAWGEAEQRAKNKAEAEKERLEKQIGNAQVKTTPKIPKARRKPLPVGKIFGGLLVLSLLAVVILPYVWPLASYVAPLEQELSAQLHQPVHIGAMNASLLPSPKLELHDVAVGGARELKVGKMEVSFDFSAIFSPTKSINNLLLSNVSLKGQSLVAVMSWLQTAGGVEKYPVARMELLNVQVSSDEIKVPALNGHADFDMQGHFSKAEMKSENGKFGVDLESVQKHLQIVINFRDTSLPMLPNIPFTDFSATGEVLNGEIAFSELYGHFYGGMLGGNARLNWQNGWLLQSRLIVKSLELQSLFPQFGITGELYGDVNITLSGNKLAQVADAPRMEGTFEAKKVVVNKMDLDTIARFGNRSDLGRGHTDFDEIKGTLQADLQGQYLRKLEVSSGLLSGSGQLEVENQQLSGKLTVELKGQRGNVPILFSGTLIDPVVRVR